MVKNKLIMKTPKRPMNTMEAYRKKQKNKERQKNKKDRYTHKEMRQKAEEEKLHPSNFPKYDDDNDNDGGFEGEEDLMELNPSTVQQILQEKQKLREKRYDQVNVTNSIQDLMQSFSKKPTAVKPQERPNVVRPQTAQPELPTGAKPEPPGGLSSFMGDNILRSFNAAGGDPNKPMFMPPNQPLPIPGQNNPAPPTIAASKTAVGDKRLQKREGAGGVLDPFMMTTMQGDYNPTQKKTKQLEAAQPFDPLLGNYVSQAPGVYQALDKGGMNPKPPINTGPAVIVKSAALTTAPLRSQMEKEKSSLVPVNVIKKKNPKPEDQEGNKTNQSTMNIGIQNVTNVPAPRTNFGFSQSIQQNVAQKEELSAFLREISELEEGS